MKEMTRIADVLSRHDKRNDEIFSLVPSENPLSPLAKRVFYFDAYARYSFEGINQWGKWAFPGGNLLGEIEEEILIPLLKEMTGGKYINVKPISGLNCMLNAILAYCKSGDSICLMPFELGGHPSAFAIARDYGLNVLHVPSIREVQDIDWERFDEMLKVHRPKLVYVDQATVLFPVSIKRIRGLISSNNLETKIHVDSSHLNGLIFGKVSPDPLVEGADSYGGSTHKTLAGPHKAFFATNDAGIYEQFSQKASVVTSHHHMADVVALAVTLLEFRDCKGSEYARKTLENAQAFGSALDACGLNVQCKDLGYTACHQVWVDPSEYGDAIEIAEQLLDAGIIVNTFNGLPTTDAPSFRIGLNEATSYGLGVDQMEVLAGFFKRIVTGDVKGQALSEQVKLFRKKYYVRQYCYSEEEAARILPMS